MFWNNLAKTVSTVIMWIILGVISGFALDRPNDAVVLTLVPLLFALIGTFFIWVAPELSKDDRDKVTNKAQDLYEKAKRRGQSAGQDKLDLLVSLMDEDELAAFKATLRQQILDHAGYADGELPYGSDTLESLMDEESHGKNARYLSR